MSGHWEYYGIRWSRRGSEKRNSFGRNRRSSPLQAVWFAGIVFFAGCQEQIVHDLSEREANKVISQLSGANLEARKVVQSDGRWAVAVPADSMIAALGILDSQRVLSNREAKNGASGKSSMIPSREEQWFRYERSVALSIEDSLAALPGVLEVRVHLNLPQEDQLFGGSKREGGSGSVLLVVDGRFDAHDEDISALVGGAAGLPRDVIRVLKSKPERRGVTEQQEASITDTPAPISVSIAESAEHVGPMPWPLGLMAVGSVVVVSGTYLMRKRFKKRVVFEMPQGLESED